MIRTILFELNNVSPVPSALRIAGDKNEPASQVGINLAQLFLHHYFDSYPAGPPKPDPTRFEYLELVSSVEDFRFHAFVAEASTVKKRSLSTEIGQAFCRLMLHDYFRIAYFAHLRNVLNRSTHRAFDGLRIERTEPGDVPDYLCARSSLRPCIAEAKGRFAPIAFGNSEFRKWREQFGRIRVVDRTGIPLRAKGYVVGTRFATEANAPSIRTCCFIEDPETAGEVPLNGDNSAPLGRAIIAMHYARIFSKVGLSSIAAALNAGYYLAEQLTYQVPIWTCTAEPFRDRRFVGGYYRTVEGSGPQLTKDGWVQPLELGPGHLAFVGVELSIAQQVVSAARGDWTRLDRLTQATPEGLWSSEFGWLLDGTVAAPATDFILTGVETL